MVESLEGPDGAEDWAKNSSRALFPRPDNENGSLDWLSSCSFDSLHIRDSYKLLNIPNCFHLHSLLRSVRIYTLGRNAASCTLGVWVKARGHGD